MYYCDNFQTRDYYSNQRDTVPSSGRDLKGEIECGRSQLAVMPDCNSSDCNLPRQNHVKDVNSYFSMCSAIILRYPGPQRRFRYGTTGLDARGWLILRVAEILGLDVQASDMIRAFAIDFETSWNSLMRLGKENFLLLRSSCTRPSQSVALLIACLLRLCHSWLLLSSSHGRLLAESCEASFKPLIEGSRYTMLTENHPN